MRARLVICAATGDIPPVSVLRWLPDGTTIWQLEDIAEVWQCGQPGKAWAMAHDLVAGAA